MTRFYRVCDERLATIDVLPKGRMRLHPGGALDPDERAAQMDLARSAAVEAGRGPETLEYTRWGSIDLTVEQVEAFAAQGVTRLVVSHTTADPERQRDEMSAFAQRFAPPESVSLPRAEMLES